MKSRVVVWTVVGLIAVVALVFVITTKPFRGSGNRLTLDGVKGYSGQAESQVNHLAMRLSQAKKAAPPGSDTVKMFGETEQLLADARDKLGLIRAAKQAQPAYESLREAKQLIRRARRSLELAGKNRAAAPSLF